MEVNNNESKQFQSLAEAILESTYSGILVIDSKRKILKYNSRFIELWNIPSVLQQSDQDEELIKFVLDQLDDPKQFLDEQPEAESFDTLHFKDGRIFDRFSGSMYFEGDIPARVWSFRDVTTTEITKQKLQKSEERLSLAMQGANDGLWDWNLETNEFYYSPRWKSMLGYKEDELVSSFETWERLVNSDDKEMVLKQVQDYIDGKSDKYEVEMRMQHKDGHEVFILSRAFLLKRENDGKAIRFVGTHVDITEAKKIKAFDDQNAKILEMIATGTIASKVYDDIALLYEAHHPGMRCSLLELKDGVLLHGGAPSMPKEYCDAVHGLKNGPSVGSCGTSTYLGQRTLVEDIATDPKWAKIKHVALPHGMRSCWSEPIKNSSGKVLGAFGMYYDYPGLPNDEESEDLKSAARLTSIVMERDQAEKRMYELAYTDELTGIANRTSFYEKLKNLISISKRNNRNFGLLYIDLDKFKRVNDTLGHDAGDLLLKEVAHRLTAISRDTDFVTRLSGDEFCIILNEIDDNYTAAIIAQRCLDSIARPMELSGRLYTPACSIGISYFPDDAQDFSSIMKVADTALYFAKEQGKNQYAFYQDELTKKAEYQFKIEHSLREAIEKEELSLVYQSQIHVKTGEIIGFEVLSRWNDPILGQVSPVEFIPIIEKIGMMKQFTAWVLRTACVQAEEWRKLDFPIFHMSVNISPSHFLDTDLVALVKDIIKETGISSNTLELEVTESVVQIDDRNLAVFKELKELGVLTSIDDFGTGYSSLASLKHLTVDCLKIDKYFIDEMLIDEKSRFLVHSIIELGHHMKYGVIAEGVESKEQLDLLNKLGCETAQGYFFSKPIDAEAVVEYVLEK